MKYNGRYRGSYLDTDLSCLKFIALPMNCRDIFLSGHGVPYICSRYMYTYICIHYMGCRRGDPALLPRDRKNERKIVVSPSFGTSLVIISSVLLFNRRIS